jgi:iron complex outermembrane receptor protein
LKRVLKRKRRADSAVQRRLAAMAMACAAVSATAQTEQVIISTSGAERRAFDTPYAVGVVDAEALRSAGPMVNLSEALGRVPGLVVNLRNNYAQDLQISSRGFGARASFGVRGIRLYADGIPAAGPDGQGQVSNFDIAGASRIEVLRGPFSALYGSSSGGVISLVSSTPVQRSVSLGVDAGSAGLRQLRLGVEAPLPGGFSIRASASSFEIDGSRPQSAAKRQLGNLRLGWEGDADRVLLVLNSVDQPAQDPLGLTRAQLDADPGQTTPQALQFDTRKQQWQSQAGVQWQHRFGNAGPLQRSAIAIYSGQRSVTQWQAIPVATQANARHPGGVIDFDRGYGGVDARLSWAWDKLRLVTGAAADSQREDRRGFENFTGTGAAQQLGVTGRLRRDENDRASSRDLFAQLELDLPANLTASGGVRRGKLTTTVADRYLSNGDDSGRLEFTGTTPALALRWQASTAVSVYASAGRGFESPTLNELAYRPDGAAGFNTGLQAQRSRQWEIGSKWRDNDAGLAVDAALFRADTTREIAVQTNSGGRSSFANVGATRREGAELSASWRITAAWRARLAATLLNARYRESFLTCDSTPCAAPTVPVAAGKRIAGTLPKALFAELAWTPGPLELGVEVRGQGRQPVNDLNSDFAAGHGLLGLRALWPIALGPGRLELLGRVDNLADRHVAGSVIVGEANQRYFEPAAGRNLLLSLRWAQGF